jgi:aryl-alcohol dehydrogenase-like predicted oxidoreductase
LYHNPRLPATVPIVGLGCSSFSTFFWTAAEQDELMNNQDHLRCDNNNSNSNSSSGWTVDTLQRHHPKVQEWIDTIRYAILECGITLLDTAPWYGHGTSEVVIGWALDELLLAKEEGVVQREDLIITTKVGRYQAALDDQFDYTYDTTLQSVDRSLQRMNLTYVNVLQLHDPEFSPNLQVLLEQTIPAMITCQQQGKCHALGMTGYPLHVQHLIFQRTLDFVPHDDGKMIWDQALTYGHYNLHDTSLVSQPLSLYTTTTTSTATSSNAATTSAADTTTFFAQYCQQHGIALLAAAPLSLGLLTPQGPPAWHPASDALNQACHEATRIAQEHHVDIATLALVVALAHPSIPCTILGMKNVHEVQLATNVANRFHQVKFHHPCHDDDDDSKWLSNILEQVLTKEEFHVWMLLQDPQEGPFAQVWKNGQYQWDGVQQAREFWKQVDGVEYEDWASTPTTAHSN